MRRMLSMGFITELHQLESELIIINNKLDSEISFDDASINKDMDFLKERLRVDILMNPKSYYNREETDVIVNHVIDSFPLDHKDYNFTSAKADFLKTGLRQVCSDAAADAREICYALSDGVTRIYKLLFSIIEKKKRIESYQYEGFWYSVLTRDDDLFSERAFNDYDVWREEHDYHDMQELEDKRTQEILALLKSGVFSCMQKPKFRDIRNSVIKINEDALEPGMEVPADIEEECARFAAFVKMESKIMTLDYVSLGKYLYRHYHDIDDNAIDALVRFDYMMDRIHHDMAECDPRLKVYLKWYEDDLQKEILENAIKVIDTCKEHLNEGVDADFLKNYLTEAYESDIKIEVQAKLKGQSKFTLICHMLGLLRTTLKVFKVDTNASDLAKTIYAVFKEKQPDTYKRYINEGARDKNSKIAKWTNEYVKEQFMSKEERLFMQIANQ